MSNNLTFRLVKKRFFIEAFLVTPAVVAFLFQWTGLTENEEIITFTMAALAAFYFISAYFPIEIKETFGMIVVNLISIGSAVCVIAILFFLTKMPGVQQMLVVASPAMATGFILSIAYLVKSKNRFYFAFALRAFILWG